jgi:hypothetical protein
MVERYAARPSVPGDEKQRLLADERSRLDEAKTRLADAVKRGFMAGELYFRGRQVSPRDLAPSFGATLTAYGNRILQERYPHLITFSVSDRDISFLIDNVDLAAPPSWDKAAWGC